MAFTVILGSLTASLQAQSLYDPRDRAFEARIRAIEPNCMPDYPPLVLDSYAYRLGAALIDQCGRENVTVQQGVKYVLLAVASLAPTPAAPAAGLYTSGELKSDAMKCVAKAFVDASRDMTASEKEGWKGRINTGFALKDWRSFAGSLKELNDPDKVAQTKASFETIAALYERGSEYVDVLQVINDSIEAGTTGISEAIFGEAETILDSYDYASRHCRYDEAEKRLGEARVAAKKECRYFGDKYRLAELSLRAHIYQHRSAITDTLTTQDPIKALNRTPQEDTYVRLHQSLLSRKRILENFADIFDRLEQEERKLRRARTDFRNDQSDYKFQVRLIRRVLDTPKVCEDIAKLRELDAGIAPECRTAFFSGANGNDMASADDLGFELAETAREKSSIWWARSDEIYQDFRACRVDAAKTKIATLKAEISSNPISVISNGECRTVDQIPLLKRLDGMSAPSYCFERPVPNVIGLTYDKAVDELYEAGLQPAEKTETKAAKEGQKVGIVVDADPAEGSMQKAGTKVALTVSKAAPAEEEKTTTMPEVIGVEKSVAAERLVQADLVPVVRDDKPADKREYKPGNVYAASKTEGDTLPVGFEVTLNAYGPRPMVVIPRVAGMTPEAAKGLLSGKNFTVGDPVPGDVAKDDQVPGEIYGTNPPEGDELEMFSDVTILKYDEPKEADGEMRAIPSVLGQTVGGAKGVLAGEDEFFSVGGVYLGDAAPADKEPGTVYEMVPGAGTMASKGTEVELTVYGPREEPSAADEPPAPPTEPDVATDDSGWLGRWRIHGVIPNKNKRQVLDAELDIANTQAGLVMTLFNRKDGALKKTVTLPIRIVDGVIQVRTELLKKGNSSSGDTQGGVVGGILKQPLSQIAQMLQQLFETLRITREGEQCKLTFQDKDRQQVIPFQCVRIGNSEQ